MQINKGSWHYKLVTMNGSEIAPYSLCPYFWKGVWHAFLLLFAIFVVCFASWGIGADLAIWLFAQCGVILSSVEAFIPGLIIGWLILAVVFGILICIGNGIYSFREHRKERKEYKKWEAARNGAYAEQQPNIIFAFIKARKEKFCPHIEFMQEK
ncbi:hypothetical protein CPTAKMNP4_098 [Salmonella phage vB_SenM-AKM_NP4]|uniref:Uncharacterized protein n=1 Tax=Salmonella phage S16 TaxID=1087482 RepID=M1EAF8_BPS16|nr:membrane protein [Salmonella phage vB_SenM-S16]AEO97060.1 hypothetical protein [Salmonella phage vB_SenM-S16]WDR21763.1 hypothetical protein PJM34_0095 [Salmonella phage vB_SenM_UTK0003]WLI71723.1 hypothetical protein CPTAKMNP4_098 [Salmonella phage vB_SenM-AKM_NP4]